MTTTVQFRGENTSSRQNSSNVCTNCQLGRFRVHCTSSPCIINFTTVILDHHRLTALVQMPPAKPLSSSEPLPVLPLPLPAAQPRPPLLLPPKLFSHLPSFEPSTSSCFQLFIKKAFPLPPCYCDGPPKGR